MTSTDRLASAIAALTGGTPLRVWSLIVTIFGDLAPGEDDWLTGALLGRLTAPLGVRPEALRVALHRLRKDGWIESRREGRESAHRLSAMARTESRTAASLIYNSTPPADLFLVLAPPGDAQGAGVTWLAPGIGISAVPVAGFCVPIDPTRLEPWMRTRTISTELAADSAQAADGLAIALRAVKAGPALSDKDQAVLRILAVHIWRRIALKAPALPDAALPAGWRGAEARSAFAELMETLPTPPISVLSGALAMVE